jgi:hypothetical protein
LSAIQALPISAAPMTLFDYGELDSETRIVVQQKTGEIKERLKRTASDIIEVGERLNDIKARLGHGRFAPWLNSEFNWSVRTAQNFMAVADAFKNANFAYLDLAPSALQALAAPSVPESARQEAIAIASNGHHVTHKEAKEIVERHKPEPISMARLFEDDDQQRQEVVESTAPVADEPETKPALELNPPPVSQGEKNAEAWIKLVSDYTMLANSIRRRGGITTLAHVWPKSRLRDMKQLCGDVVTTFSAYRDELKEVLK